MATQYDPGILSALADRLYARARLIVAVWTLLLGVLGGGLGLAAPGGAGLAIVGMLVGSAFGFILGQSRSLMLRVTAQLALCQKQIEENTRR